MIHLTDADARPLNLTTLASGDGDPIARGVLVERMKFAQTAGFTFNGGRDMNTVLGYPAFITAKQYRDRYARGGIAGRIVDAICDATWRGAVELIENENNEEDTAFEEAWTALDQRLQIQAKVLRGDKLSRLSSYAVLLLGAPGELQTPLEKARKPEELAYIKAYSGGDVVSTSLQRAQAQAMSSEADCVVGDLDLDPHSPRFGLPETYKLRYIDPKNPHEARTVHHSRIVHLAEGCLNNEIYGQPALERVWNLLDDLDKVTGGGAEAFWLRANQGLHLNIDPAMPVQDVEKQIAKLTEQSEDYKHQLTRWLRTRGVDVKTLGSDVANFSQQADAIIKQIAGAKGMPMRVLTGSEMGELASSQDRDNWKDQVNGRQTSYAGPYIMRRLADRLIEFNFLPTPAEGAQAYEVRWPQTQVLTEEEKHAGAKAWADCVVDGAPVFTVDEIRDKWYQMDPQEPLDAALVEELEAALGKNDTSTVTRLLGLTA